MLLIEKGMTDTLATEWVARIESERIRDDRRIGWRNIWMGVGTIALSLAFYFLLSPLSVEGGIYNAKMNWQDADGVSTTAVVSIVGGCIGLWFVTRGIEKFRRN